MASNCEASIPKAKATAGEPSRTSRFQAGESQTRPRTREPLLVAEEQAAYAAQSPEDDTPAQIGGVALAVLADRVGFSREELAGAVQVAAHTPEMLSPALVRWIAAALGISEDEARHALAAGG